MPDLLTPEEVLARYSGGPDTGIFTDGSCDPNPGPGGWGLVWVEAGQIREERNGREADTTNNRMELTALIEALELLAEDARVSVYSDSQLCVKTVNEWAAGWERRGWKRKSGPIKNLDLVRPLCPPLYCCLCPSGWLCLLVLSSDGDDASCQESRAQRTERELERLAKTLRGKAHDQWQDRQEACERTTAIVVTIAIKV